MKYTLKIKMLPGEKWYGGHVAKGYKMPFGAGNFFRADNNATNAYNQTSTLYLSDQGRYIWSDQPFKLSSFLGHITCHSTKGDISLEEGLGDLRGAYLHASAHHFPPDGKMPNELMFRVPQYCTWIQLLHNQTQKGILSYADSIVTSGMPTGEILIDDGWQRDFGDWDFDQSKFANPKKMVDSLHAKGFKVILWICPFVSPNAPDYPMLADKNWLVRDKAGNIALRKWWNGKSAVLDLSNPDSFTYFTDTCDRLMRDYGIDGFKQDAGDIDYYRDSDRTFGGVSASEQCEIWAKSAINYSFNELRACFKCGGMGIAQRLSDKSHQWNALMGLRGLIPNATLQGLLGYPFLCPDMIGGGQANDFKKERNYDHELFVRYSQVSALMPMMQYSFALWTLKDTRTAELCKDACAIHEKYSEYILQLAEEASKTGEPIIRAMEYAFPHQGMDKAKQQFMLGDQYLVAPMVWKNKQSRKVLFPHGEWIDIATGQKIKGGQTLEIACSIDKLPIFQKV